MKALAAAFALCCVAMPAHAATFVIDGTHGGDVTFDSFDVEIPFTMELLGGSIPASFTTSFSGFITADARYCAQFLPGEEPADCYVPINPVSSQDSFTAEPGSIDASVILPFSMSGTGAGFMHFSETDGGSVRITIDNAALVDDGGLSQGGSASAVPVPEPGSWALTLAGFGMIGGTMRARRKTPHIGGRSSSHLS
jgi:hypothetical protein